MIRNFGWWTPGVEAGQTADQVEKQVLAQIVEIGARQGGKLYRYYVSQTVLKHGAGSCPVGRVPAGEIEAAVIDQLRTVFRQPEIVTGTLKAARAQDGEITEAEAREALQQLDPLWDELFPAEQARIVALVVERVDIGTDGLNVRLRVDGLAGLASEMTADLGAAA